MGGRGEKGRVWLQAAQSPCPTGFVKHTPNKLRAPAYSIHGAPMLLAENCSPGPRYSVNPKILRTGKDLGPAYSILGRYCTKTTLTPGPGEGLWPCRSPAQPCWWPLQAWQGQGVRGTAVLTLLTHLSPHEGVPSGLEVEL